MLMPAVSVLPFGSKHPLFCLLCGPGALDSAWWSWPSTDVQCFTLPIEGAAKRTEKKGGMLLSHLLLFPTSFGAIWVQRVPAMVRARGALRGALSSSLFLSAAAATPSLQGSAAQPCGILLQVFKVLIDFPSSLGRVAAL